MNMVAEVMAECPAPTQGMSRLETSIRSRVVRLVSDFHLEWQEYGWILRGHARSYYAKQFAQETVMNNSKHPIYANDIEVR